MTIGSLPATVSTGTVYTEGRSIAVSNGSFTDDFAQWGVHVYHFVPDAPPPPPPRLRATALLRWRGGGGADLVTTWAAPAGSVKVGDRLDLTLTVANKGGLAQGVARHGFAVRERHDLGLGVRIVAPAALPALLSSATSTSSARPARFVLQSP